MYDQFDEVNAGDAFRDRFMILMALIMERHGIPVIGINPGSGNEKCFTCMSAAWKMASGPWSLSTTCNSRKKTHRPDPSWNGRCVCLAEIFPVCFHPLKPPGVRHCTMELSEVSISIPLRFFYWNLTDEWISMGRKRMKIVIHGWLGGTQLLWFSEFCHPASLKHRWKHGIRWVEKPEFVMLDALVFWITFSGFPEKLIPADSADTAETHGFKAFPGFWQGKPLIKKRV